MANILRVVSSIFNKIFSYGQTTVFFRFIRMIQSSPYLLVGVVLMIIGFSVSLIKRIIHS